MPTGGAAIMREGKNLLKLARKEQVGKERMEMDGKTRPALSLFRPRTHAVLSPFSIQCLALLNQLRSKFKATGEFYRVFPNGEVQYLHPKVNDREREREREQEMEKTKKKKSERFFVSFHLSCPSFPPPADPLFPPAPLSHTLFPSPSLSL